MSSAAALDQTFAALAHPVRRQMLSMLAAGNATVKELAEPFAMSLPAISKHIKVLQRAGLITQGQDAQFRPCALNPAPLKEVASWTEQYRPIWEARFDRLASLLNTLSEAHDEQ
ncbi:MAG: metalloregulator ArsR/SmtB family transcription factor [Pseudomonadota bacterium]